MQMISRAGKTDTVFLGLPGFYHSWVAMHINLQVGSVTFYLEHPLCFFCMVFVQFAVDAAILLHVFTCEFSNVAIE